MFSQRDKAEANVLDYHIPDQPESKKVRRLFRVTIGLFLFLVVTSLIFLLIQKTLLLVYYSEENLPYKLGFAVSKLLVPLLLLLAAIGLYHRHRFAYSLVGAFFGVSIFNVFTRMYSFFAFGGQFIEDVPDVKLISFTIPLLLIAYLIYFYVNEEVINLIGYPRTIRISFILLGLFLAGVGYLFTYSIY